MTLDIISRDKHMML